MYLLTTHFFRKWIGQIMQNHDRYRKQVFGNIQRNYWSLFYTKSQGLSKNKMKSLQFWNSVPNDKIFFFFWKETGSLSREVKDTLGLHQDPAILLLQIYPRKMKVHATQTHSKMLTCDSLKDVNSLNVHGWVNLRTWYIFIQRNIWELRMISATKDHILYLFI